jgi:hypothetical protein
MEKVQVIKCKCGSVIAACLEPECYQEVEWMRELRRYSKEGYDIEMINKEDFKFGKCKCNNKEDTTTKQSISPKQLKLF